MSTWDELFRGLPQDSLPKRKPLDTSVAHAPVRTPNLTDSERQVGHGIKFALHSHLCTVFSRFLLLKLAVKNALRYFLPGFHVELAKEFAEELESFGHIYMYRFRPLVPLR